MAELTVNAPTTGELSIHVPKLKPKKEAQVNELDRLLAGCTVQRFAGRITWYSPLVFGILHWRLLQNRMIGPWDLGPRLSSLPSWFGARSSQNIYLILTYLIPSRLTKTISSAYERYLRKSRDK